jgi:TatD DNase family protein
MTAISVDAHAHINPEIPALELHGLGAFVMAVTRSLHEAGTAVRRTDEMTVWGVGCHPGIPEAIEDFNPSRFKRLVRRAAFVGEVGLDGRSRVPMKEQREVLSKVLDAVAETPRALSLHSVGASAAVLGTLERHPVALPILHWWRGNPDETARAVELGCLFSLNGHEARVPKVIHAVPLDRVLTETDFPHSQRYDSAANRPAAVRAIEQALAAQHSTTVTAVRDRIWETLVPIVDTMPDSVVSDVLRLRIDAARLRRTARDRSKLPAPDQPT